MPRLRLFAFRSVRSVRFGRVLGGSIGRDRVDPATVRVELGESVDESDQDDDADRQQGDRGDPGDAPGQQQSIATTPTVTA